ncbi:hypothetical protein ASG01_14005 [Chryseobacterium sp. Leaf180]|uniref:hypothetical protein n=1 Tax=Chryseobacterium sp. Leaf180 TaxID=1736289 RepID=UPI000700B919|nr:hypothetical protein [Chryseobacterium sp. Leaf180]KQR91480.1 hypothetical protein ASG01_14005 [Chryseobacterium sp. Leaf180]
MKKTVLALAIVCSSFIFAQKSKSYVEISYASICCGTPSTAPLMMYVSQFQKKNKMKSMEILRQSGLGREGEFNLYIGLDSFSKSKRSSFIKGLETAILKQNSARNKSSDGIVNFESSKIITQAEVKDKNLMPLK